MIRKTLVRRLLALTLALSIGALHAPPARAAMPSPQPNQPQVFHSFAMLARAPDISATVSSSRSALASVGPVAWVCNTGAVFAYVMLGDSTVVVTASNGFPIPPGQCATLTANGATHIAGITASSTATVQVATGTGNP